MSERGASRPGPDLLWNRPAGPRLADHLPGRRHSSADAGRDRGPAPTEHRRRARRCAARRRSGYRRRSGSGGDVVTSPPLSERRLGRIGRLGRPMGRRRRRIGVASSSRGEAPAWAAARDPAVERRKWRGVAGRRIAGVCVMGGARRASLSYVVPRSRREIEQTHAGHRAVMLWPPEAPLEGGLPGEARAGQPTRGLREGVANVRRLATFSHAAGWVCLTPTRRPSPVAGLSLPGARGG